MAPSATGQRKADSESNQSEGDDVVALKELRVHIRIVSPIPDLATMVSNATDIYRAAGIEIVVESLPLPLVKFETLSVGTCEIGLRNTAQQNELYRLRASAASELVVYCVRTLDPPLNGCAAHPRGLPSLAISSIASLWTLAHEIGHILGLPDVDDTDRLMNAGTKFITNPPPDFHPDEIKTMLTSRLLR